MKTRIVTVFLAVFLFLVLCAPVFADAAEWTGYRIDELGITFYLPGDYDVFTRHMDDSDPRLASMDVTAEQFAELLAYYGYYIDAYDAAYTSEIYVQASENSSQSFSEMSDAALLGMAAITVPSFERSGILILDYDVYHHGDITFVRYHESSTFEDGSSNYGIQYYTVEDGMAINLVFTSFGDDVTESEISFMQSVVDHTIFGDQSPVIASAADPQDTLRTFTLDNGPFTVTLDTGKYNVLIQGMEEDDPAVIRTGLKAGYLDGYLSSSKRDLLMYALDDSLPPKFDITIRIKDNRYEGLDLRKCSSTEATTMLDTIYAGFTMPVPTNKDIILINGTPYLVFDWDNSYQQRYATIINGDMIYIYATRDEGPLTDDDRALLRSVVESVIYPE